MARTGLRMMPTFPSSPLRFRTAGFPQYGSKAGLSDGAFPCGASIASLGLHPSFVSSAASILLALCRGSWLSATPPCERFYRRTPGALAPVRVIVSRSIITYSAPSDVLADTPQFPRMAGYMRRLRCAGWCRPRPSASISELSLSFLLSMSPSTPPESPPTARTQFFVGGGSPSSSALLDSALSTPHFYPLHVEFTFGVSWFAHSLQPAELLASLADLTRHSLPSQRRLLLPSFRPSRSPFSPSDISTVASGHLGIWAPPPTGLSPVGTAASFAARAE
jgi:hypothetical protein